MTMLDAPRIPIPVLHPVTPRGRKRSRPLILLIDPDAASREIHSLLVRYYGYDVRSTPSAITGLAIAHAEAPDAIVCELFADAPAGQSTVALLKADSFAARIPVVVVGGRDEDREDARAAGAFEFLCKPCRGDLLKDALTRLAGASPPPAAAAA